MKKRVVALLLGLAAISLAACGGKKAESQAETTKAAGREGKCESH